MLATQNKRIILCCETARSSARSNASAPHARRGGGGIKQAVSDNINRDYVFDPAKVDPETVRCEAPNVWKRSGEKVTLRHFTSALRW
jgi:hypothetical protein